MTAESKAYLVWCYSILVLRYYSLSLVCAKSCTDKKLLFHLVKSQMRMRWCGLETTAPKTLNPTISNYCPSTSQHLTTGANEKLTVMINPYIPLTIWHFGLHGFFYSIFPPLSFVHPPFFIGFFLYRWTSCRDPRTRTIRSREAENFKEPSINLNPLKSGAKLHLIFFYIGVGPTNTKKLNYKILVTIIWTISLSIITLFDLKSVASNRSFTCLKLMTSWNIMTWYL